jgi:hypothetical protein
MPILVAVWNLLAAVWNLLGAISATAWTAIATWFLAVGTVFVVRWQVQEQRRSNAALLAKQHETNAVTVLIRLAETWDSDPMRRNRKQLSGALMDTTVVGPGKARKLMGPVAGFFERVAFLAHRGVLDQEMVWSEFSYFILHYYAALAEGIQHERRQEEDPTLYNEFEGLDRQMHSLATERRGQDATPTRQNIRDFLENEPNN